MPLLVEDIFVIDFGGWGEAREHALLHIYIQISLFSNNHLSAPCLCIMTSVEQSVSIIVPVLAKEKASKKKASAKPKVAPSHPLYLEMNKEAIIALKERTSSSQIAIAKFIEEKHKSHLPPNFKKLLLVQLKKLVAGGKLVKVKGSFKLPAALKPIAKKLTGEKAVAKKKVAVKPKAAAKKPASAKAKGVSVK